MIRRYTLNLQLLSLDDSITSHIVIIVQRVTQKLTGPYSVHAMIFCLGQDIEIRCIGG